MRKQIVDHSTHWEDWSRIHRLAHAKGFYGVGHLLYGSDYPYYQPAESLAFVRECLTEAEADAVLWENPMRLLRLSA